MIGSRVRTYLNQDQTEGLSVFKQEKGFYVLLRAPDLLDTEVLEKYCVSIVERVSGDTFVNATEFDEVMSDAFKTANLPLLFSIACLCLKENTVYLKTYGQGTVILRREGRQVPLVSSGAFASGKIGQGDEMALSFGENDPFENRDNSVHIEFGLEDGADTVGEDAPDLQEETKLADIEERNPLRRRIDIIKLIRTKLAGRKMGPFIIVAIVGALLLIVFIRNYTSKTAQEDRLNLENATSTITQKLEQAVDVFELNSGRSVALLVESKRDLKSLEQNLHSSHKSEIEQLAAKIEATEKKILQKNIKSAEEFIDLGLE